MHSTDNFLKWALGSLGCLAAVVATLALAAAPAHADGTFFLSGNYEIHDGFALRRSINAFQSPVVTTDPSGMGAIVISPSVFSSVGDPVHGAVVVNFACDPNDPNAIICILSQAIAGFQPFPGFPNFAQAASTFTEKNLGTLSGQATGTLAPGGGPGSFDWCPTVGNPANGTAFPWTCPGLGFGSPTGVQGLVQYSGGNGFGGTMAVLRQSTVEISQRRNVGPTRFQHDRGIYDNVPWNVGVLMSFTNSITPTAGPLTQSPVFGPFSSIQTLGSVVAATGDPVLVSASTGFPWTTGQVRVAEDSCLIDNLCPSPFNPNPFIQFTVTGADARGADGQGRLSLVSGAMIQNRDGVSANKFGTLDLVLALPEPTLALGMGAGMLLLVGLARRRA